MSFGLPSGDFAHCHRICPSSHIRGLDFITCRTRCVVPRPLAPQRGESRWLTRKRITTLGRFFKGSEKSQFRWCGPISRNHDATVQTPPTPQVTAFSRFRQNPMAAYIVFPPSPPHTRSSLLRYCSPQVRGFSQFRDGVKVLVRASRIDRD